MKRAPQPAATADPKRGELSQGAMGAFLPFVNLELLPYLRGLRDRPGASLRQQAISESVDPTPRR